jgi:crotonobetainyl-CoA:carnitine CoA-transferase CaiB-like acyl-CoA transferase|tara:strand:+ start:6677 stop:7900 length:1224 start_codon:yes stop_codon:yes gene_type:complete
MSSDKGTNDNAPLNKIRVLDIATFIAAPFCGVILADFGAEVLKIEKPGEGDPLRQFGTPVEPDQDTFVWLTEARNKKSVTLDLRTAKGVELFKGLVKQSDIVLENFRPGTLEKWGIGFDVLSEINPRLIMLRVSGYGQDGPYSSRPGFARAAHAFAGLSYLCGEPGQMPVMPGSTSLADYVSGMWGTIGIMMALEARRKTGKGQVVDIALYESVFRLMDEMLPVYQRTGFIRERMGADTVNAVPHSHYQTRDGKYVALACSSDKIFERMCHIMGCPENAMPNTYRKVSAREENRALINKIVQDWFIELDASDAISRCQQGGVPCSVLYSIEDIYNDPHYQARGNFQIFNDPRFNEVTVTSALPRLSDTPAVLQNLGPALGDATDSVYKSLLNLTDQDIQSLKEERVI